MSPAVTYTLYATSSKEQTGDVITFTQFEEGNILTETRNDSESGDKSVDKSIMMSKQDMENLDSNEQSDHDLISMDILQDIFDGSQTHSNVNKNEARYKICNHIRQRQLECKGALKDTQSMGKGVNYCEISFTTVLNTLCKPFPMLHVAFNAPFHSDCLCLIR